MDLIEPESFALYLAQRQIRLMGPSDVDKATSFVRSVLASQSFASANQFAIELSDDGEQPAVVRSKRTNEPIAITAPYMSLDPVTLLHLTCEVLGTQTSRLRNGNRNASFPMRYNELVWAHLPAYWDKFAPTYDRYLDSLTLATRFEKQGTRAAIVFAMYAELAPRQELRGTHDRWNITLDSGGRSGTYGEMVISKVSGNVVTATLTDAHGQASTWRGKQVNEQLMSRAGEYLDLRGMPIQFTEEALQRGQTTYQPTFLTRQSRSINFL